VEEKIMTKKKNKVLALALAACMSFGTLSVFGGIGAREALSASALDTTTQMTYPFETGENAFKNAPTVTAPSTANSVTSDPNDYFEVLFDNWTNASAGNFSTAKYVAVQMKVNSIGYYQTDGNNAGWGISVNIGLLSTDGGRHGTYDYTANTGKNYYWLSEDGTLTAKPISYGTITFAKSDEGKQGTLILPMADLTSVNWGAPLDASTQTMKAVIYDISQEYYNYSFTWGEIGVYTGEPGADGTVFNKVVDLSKGERKGMYGVYKGATIAFPSESVIPEPEPPALNAYPFRTGEEAMNNTQTWSGFVVDGSQDNQQTVKVKFDTETADFSNAEYLVVQYKNNSAPGLQYILNEGAHNYSVAGKNDERIYFAEEGSAQSALSCKITFDHINVSQSNKMGALIIPMTSMKWNGTAGDLSKIDALTITTNARFNGGFELLIGEIGMYDEDTQTFTKLLDLSTDKSAKFTVTSALETNKGILTPFVPVLTQLGDASIDFRADKMTDAVYDENGKGAGIWDGGSYGKRTATGITDSYGQQAVQFTSLGTNPDGDAYCAFDLAPAGGFSWAEKKGVSFWARNDSDTEISFNIEVDCRIPDPNDPAKTISDRFNIKQGFRFYLYDVNTGKTSIYMTRPCATLPVGFEGWVRIPFGAFSRADWSSNGVTQEMFMGVGSTVSYLAITVHAATYQNKSFTVNMFGAYETSPTFDSVYVNANGNTIPELMRLSELMKKEEN